MAAKVASVAFSSDKILGGLQELLIEWWQCRHVGIGRADMNMKSLSPPPESKKRKPRSDSADSQCVGRKSGDSQEIMICSPCYLCHRQASLDPSFSLTTWLHIFVPLNLVPISEHPHNLGSMHRTVWQGSWKSWECLWAAAIELYKWNKDFGFWIRGNNQVFSCRLLTICSSWVQVFNISYVIENTDCHKYCGSVQFISVLE